MTDDVKAITNGQDEPTIEDLQAWADRLVESIREADCVLIEMAREAFMNERGNDHIRG